MPPISLVAFVAAVIPLLITTWDLFTLSRPKFRKILLGTSALWIIGAATIVIKKALPNPLSVESSHEPMLLTWGLKCLRVSPRFSEA